MDTLCYLVEMEQLHLNHGTDRQRCQCTVPKAVYTVKKCSWGWSNLSPKTCRADLKRLINEKVVASCWLLTSLNYRHVQTLDTISNTVELPRHDEAYVAERVKPASVIDCINVQATVSSTSWQTILYFCYYKIIHNYSVLLFQTYNNGWFHSQYTTKCYQALSIYSHFQVVKQQCSFGQHL